MGNQSVCRRASRLAAAFALVAASAGAAVLFPQPLHIVRTIEDPIAQTTVTIEEYCSANRIVSVRGDTTTIVDAGEVVEIDRTAGTWSRSRFEEIAQALPAQAATAAAAPTVRAIGSRLSASGHPLEVLESSDESGGVRRRIEVAIDREVSLTRDALEALIGAAHPQAHGGVHDVILAAAAEPRASISATAAATAPEFGLPAEIIISITADGETLTERNVIARVDRRTVPPEVLLIPPGARRVESRLVRFAKEAEALDHPKSVHR